MNQQKTSLTFSKERIALAAFCAFLAAALVWLFERQAVDDAFISFRYAWNLHDGNGLVFNPGERVEGFSNLLWVLLVAPLPQAAETIARVVSLASMAGIGLVAARLARHLGVNPWLGAIVGIGCPSLAVSASSGLETASFAFLVLLMLTLQIEGRADGAFGIAAVLCLLRPEGPMLYAGLLLWNGLFGDRKVFARPAATIPLVVIGSLTAFRWAYFGDVLPNTYYAKSGDAVKSLFMGVDYAKAFFLAYPALLLGLLAWRRNRLPAAFSICWCAYVVAVGGDWLYYHRFFVPIAPVLGVAALSLFAKRPRAVAAVAVLIALNFAWQATELGIRSRNRALERDRFVFRHAARLADLKPGSSIATGNPGYLGYVNMDLAIHDMLGLTDPHIARSDPHADIRLQGHDKFDIDYTLSRRPDVFLPARQFVRKEGEPLVIRNPHALLVHEHAMLGHPDFARGYAPVAAPMGQGLRWWYWKRVADDAAR